MSSETDPGSGILTDEYLDSRRLVGDPAADEAIAELISRPDAGQLIGHLMHSRFKTADEAPPPLRDLFSRLQTLPDWVDRDRVRIAEKLCLEFGFVSSTILACASLPECYSSGTVAKALNFTRFLTDKTPRRVLETSQFVMDVMRPGGVVDADGNPGVGVASTIKVRLIHAMIRFLISHPPERLSADSPQIMGVFAQQEWDFDSGLPINQEDLAFVLLTFSWVAVRILRSLVDITEEEADAYIHCWNVIGHILGIEDGLLAGDAAQAERLFERLAERGRERCVEGEQLTAALLAFGRQILPFALRSVPHVLMREYLYRDTADLLGVKRITWLQKVAAAFVAWALRRRNERTRELYQEHPSLSVASVWLHEKLLQRWGKMREDGSFDFPSESEAWLLPRLRRFNESSEPVSG